VAPKRERQQRILEIVARNSVDSHEVLLDLLLAEGVPTTQSTLSRDLRELGVVKGADGYRLLGPGGPRPHLLRDLARSLRPHIVSWDTGGNIVVLKPAEGGAARRVAEIITEARAPELVASLECGGSVIVVARTPAQARDLARKLG
jgi:transcriptional regulator of arginine metabolism